MDRAKLFRVPVRGVFDRMLTLAPDSLLAGFESLGHGCEFGIAQRFVGIEPLGLFRFATLPHEALLSLLKNRFSDLAYPDAISVLVRENEFYGHVRIYGIEYHTGTYIGQMSEEEVLSRERIRLQFYKQKILEDLSSGDKIFVRFDDEVNVSAIQQLFLALNDYGPNSLLWVDKAATQRLVGVVEQIEAGLVRGYVEQRSNYAAPTPHALSVWLQLAFDARKLLAYHRNDGSIVARGSWVMPNAAITTVAGDESGAPFGRQVLEHTLTVDTTNETADVLIYHVPVDMRPNVLYTISSWVWIPLDFQGTDVAMVAAGFPSVHGWLADLGKRDGWQHIVTSFRQPNGHHGAAPGLRAIGRSGDRFFSRDWRIDEGAVPTTYFG